MIVLKADQAARDSRQTKQDRYAEMRRRKDEEREAQERMLVCDHFLFVGFSVCAHMWVSFVEEFFHGSLGRRSRGSQGQGGGSCCTGV